MMNYTAMPQKKPVMRDSAEKRRKSRTLSLSEGSLQMRRVCELDHAVDEIVRLKEANTKLRKFAAVVSHDLREPLRTISAYTELLNGRYRGRLDADGDEFLTFITGGAKWMTQVIDDLLSDPSRAACQACRWCVDSQELCDAAVRNLDLAIAEAGAAVRCGPLPKVLANRELTLVFQNLIGNAIKYRGEAPPRIRVWAEREQGGYWRFAVADNGVGFDMAHANELFNPCYRLKSAEECPGTGMGLAICQDIIRQIGGRIWAHSEPQRGSTFFFCVPVVSEAENRESA